MFDYLVSLFEAAQFMPHGMCLLWRPDLLLMHGLSDLLIAAAYFTIPLLILRAVRARPDLIDKRVARLFAAFITLCALSHAAGLLTLWVPAYGLQAVIKIATALVSVATALILARGLPALLTMPSRSEMENSQAAVLTQTMAAVAAEESRARLERMQEELLRSNRDLDEFAYIASHDLKEPLRGVSINANFILREDISPSVRTRVERMAMLCQRMEGLIADLLYYSRLGRTDTAVEDVDPAPKIAQIGEDLQEDLAERPGEIRVETPLPNIHAARGKVTTVFRNLIVNALKYNESPRRLVRVGFCARAEVNGTGFENAFYVADNGIGIAPRQRDKVFRIFSRLNTDDRFGPGSGAGLSFVKRIVEDYGGRIDFVSEPDEGTTFYFTLPLTRTPRATSPARRSEVPA